MIIHQLFGFLGDTEMPKMFSDNQILVKKFCKDNDYEYKLWTPTDVNEILEDYSKYIDMYDNVRYPIQKVDIIRFLILHKYGGVYLDLDIQPKIEKLKNYSFACCYRYVHKNNKFLYEIEVLQSDTKNPILLNYLDYVKTQISEKNNIDVYNKWKARYVYQTTGPMCFTRFIKQNKIQIDLYKSNNSYIDSKNEITYLTGDEDFISLPSFSWQ
jgi:mannosyltransferase OCH1-like enzyme